MNAINMNTQQLMLTIFTILALATPIFGEEATAEVKIQDKRGIIGYGLGYGAGHGLGYKYNGLAHGYLANPAINGHTSYTAPLALPHNALGISHGYGYPGYINGNYRASDYTAPFRFGYAGLDHGFDHALGYRVNAW